MDYCLTPPPIPYNSLIMIDPHSITNYHRTERELQEFLIFCVFVQGKQSRVQARKLADFLLETGIVEPLMPFDLIRAYINSNALGYHLERAKVGQYNQLTRCLNEIVNADLDLRTCTVEQLETIYRIGPKSARFFLLHSRENQRYAVLDTHILSWMRENGFQNIPKQTPTIQKYHRIEREFLDYCDSHGLSPSHFDLMIWSKRSA
jgi:thermostable 8-oxoguanine DNA glycosylase